MLLSDTPIDFIGLAQTGTGKTAAFGMPLLQKIDSDSKHTQGLILSPTRELCMQITKEIQTYAKHMPKVNVVAVYGGANIQDQSKKIKKGAQIIVKIHKKLLDALYPDFSISKNIILKGKIASDSLRSQLILDAPLMRWKDIQFQNIHFQIDTNNPIYNTFLSIEEFSHEYYTGSDFNMISTKLSDTLYFRSVYFVGPKETLKK